MKLNHVGIEINREEEIDSFYQKILGFHLERTFEIPAQLSETLFGIREPVQVFLIKKNDNLLELFVYSSPNQSSYRHLCLEVPDRESLADQCTYNNYPVIRVKREERDDLLFIKDRSGNIFELTETKR